MRAAAPRVAAQGRRRGAGRRAEAARGARRFFARTGGGGAGRGGGALYERRGREAAATQKIGGEGTTQGARRRGAVLFFFCKSRRPDSSLARTPRQKTAPLTTLKRARDGASPFTGAEIYSFIVGSRASLSLESVYRAVGEGRCGTVDGCVLLQHPGGFLNVK